MPTIELHCESGVLPAMTLSASAPPLAAAPPRHPFLLQISIIILLKPVAELELSLLGRTSFWVTGCSELRSWDAEGEA